MSDEFRSPCGVSRFRHTAICAAVLLLCGVPVAADDDDRFELEKLRSIGQLKGTVADQDRFVRIDYVARDERGRRRAKKGILQLTDKTKVFQDERIELEGLEPGDSVYIFGRPVAREVRDRNDPNNRRGKDRQIQAASLLLAGEGLEVNEKFVEPRDKTKKWCEAKVKMVRGGLWVEFEGEEHRVTLKSGAPILRRKEASASEVPEARYAHAVGKQTIERPPEENSSDERRTCFATERVVLLEPRIPASLLPALFREPEAKKK